MTLGRVGAPAFLHLIAWPKGVGHGRVDDREIVGCSLRWDLRDGWRQTRDRSQGLEVEPRTWTGEKACSPVDADDLTLCGAVI